MKMFGGFRQSSVSGTHGSRENEKKHFIVILIMVGNCYENKQESQENGETKMLCNNEKSVR
jgi:hypothetical protein